MGVRGGQKFPPGDFDAHGASGAFGTLGALRPVPLATNCWPEVPGVGGDLHPGACRVGTRGGGGGVSANPAEPQEWWWHVVAHLPLTTAAEGLSELAFKCKFCKISHLHAHH